MEDVILKSKKGFKWALFGNLIKGGMVFLTLLFLTFYLGPEKMGLVSIILVIYGLSETFVQFGISQSIIAREKNTSEELSSIFWTNLGIGFFVFIIINLIANLLASFYNQPGLGLLIRFLSIIFLIEPLDLVFRAILEKELKFPLLEKINIIRSSTLGMGTIILVLLGFDIFGYVFAMILSILISTTLLAYVFLDKRIWFPKFHFRLNDIKGHYKFGFFVTAKSFLNYAGRNFDELIIGKVMGLEILGIYYFAKKIVEYPAKFFSISFSKVAFPLYSKLKSNILQLKKVYFNLTNLIANTGFFFFGLLIILTPFILPLFFDNKWNLAIIPIQIFSIIAFLSLISAGFMSSILYCFNNPKLLFKTDLLLTPLRLLIIYLATFINLNIVVLTYLISVITKLLILQIITNRYIKTNLKEYILNIKYPLINIIITLFLTFLIVNLFFLESLILKIFLITIIFIIIYINLILINQKKFILNIKKELKLIIK